MVPLATLVCYSTPHTEPADAVGALKLLLLLLLSCLPGDKPELLYPEAAAELAGMGFSSTLDYVAAAAAAVLQQTGLIPHLNAGVMDQQQLQR